MTSPHVTRPAPTGSGHLHAPGADSERPTRYRWSICLLLFVGLLINYIDRQILSLLKPILDEQLHWTNAQFGAINSAFQLAYAVSLFSFGWLVDRHGSKIGYAISISAWSLAAAGHALVTSIPGFFVARVALGLGEGGSFPASIKAVALWFPQRERALATSLFNTGANVGALAAPAVVPFVAIYWGWHMAFILAAIAGFVWLAFWWVLYDSPAQSKRVNAAELHLIREEAPPATIIPAAVSDVPPTAMGELPAAAGITPPSIPAPLPLARLLRHKQAWSFVVGKFMTDPVWWFFLIWLPDFFKQARGMDIKSSWILLVTIYGIVTVLSILGGWLPGRLVRTGMAPGSARKLTMLIAAVCALPIVLATQVGDWGAVVLIGLAGAAHQAWSANLYSTVSDMFPKQVVATLVGFGSMAGSVGSILFPLLTGWLLDHFKAAGHVTTGYTILFVACGCAYLLAFTATHLLAPRFEPLKLG